MNPRVVAALARKDIVDAIKNRYLLTALLTPLVVALLMRVLIPSISGLNNSNDLNVVVHDTGNSVLVAQLRNTPKISLIASGSAEAVANEVEKQKATGGLVVPVNFDADVAAGKEPQLTIYVNNKGIIEQATFRQLMERQVSSLVKQPVTARPVWIDLGKEPGSQAGGKPDLNHMFLPLLLLLAFAMIGALVVPLLLVEEKEKRTLDFLLTSPASLTEIVTGKALTGVVYSLLISGALLAINHKLISNWPLTLLTILLGLLFIVAIGLFMGSLFQNAMQVNTWASVVLFVLLAPSFPSPGGLPAAMEAALHVVPTSYFVEALKLSLAGRGSSAMWGHLGVLLAFTAVAFSAAIWRLRREES